MSKLIKRATLANILGEPTKKRKSPKKKTPSKKDISNITDIILGEIVAPKNTGRKAPKKTSTGTGRKSKTEMAAMGREIQDYARAYKVQHPGASHATAMKAAGAMYRKVRK